MEQALAIRKQCFDNGDTWNSNFEAIQHKSETNRY